MLTEGLCFPAPVAVAATTKPADATADLLGADRENRSWALVE
jgi:hypothetical protein